MAEIPPRSNCNLTNLNNNDSNRDKNPPPPPPRVNLSQEDMMAITTIVATTLQRFVNPNENANQPPPELQPYGIKYHYKSFRRNRIPTSVETLVKKCDITGSRP